MTVLCESCQKPLPKGGVPIILPAPDDGRRVFCSVACVEKVIGLPFPEPHRTHLIETEQH